MADLRARPPVGSRKARRLAQWPLSEALAHQGHLEGRRDALLPTSSDHPDGQRLEARLARHRHERSTSLLRPGVEPTNPAAERELRPSLIPRRITHRSRSAEGVHCHSVLTSILATARCHGADLSHSALALLLAPTDAALRAGLAPP